MNWSHLLLGLTVEVEESCVAVAPAAVFFCSGTLADMSYFICGNDVYVSKNGEFCASNMSYI
jgi:hypothetical protein